MDPRGDEHQRRGDAPGGPRPGHAAEFPPAQDAAFRADSAGGPADSSAGQSLLAPLAAEDEAQMQALRGQLEYCQGQMGRMGLQLQDLVAENERLHRALKEAVQQQLAALPVDAEAASEAYVDAEVLGSLREQLRLCQQEKAQAVELWQAASRELERLQALYQERMTEAHVCVAASRKQQDQLTGFQRLTTQLHVAHESAESTNQQLLQTAVEQSLELEQLRKQLRQAKSELRAAAAREEELARAAGALQGEMRRKEGAAASARGREEAADRRGQQLQTDIRQLESRLRVALQDAGQLRAERARLEQQASELQARCAALESEVHHATLTARDSLKLLEDASLQRNQALLEEKQKEEEVEKLRKTVAEVLLQCPARIQKEVENARRQHQAQVSRLSEELASLQLECAERQSQLERAARERKALEDQLDKALLEGRGGEGERRRLDEMLGRCLAAERARDELQRSLRAAEHRARQLERSSEEELSRGQEAVRTLQAALEAERESCGLVSEQRLQLQQENEQLQLELEELRRAALEAQRQARLKVSAAEQELSARGRGFEAQLRELEDSGRSSADGLRQLLAAQQKAAGRWREEARRAAAGAEARVGALRAELSQQKLQSQELLLQLEAAREKATEHEKLLLEQQDKADRLQRRLSQAEQRAASAVQQLGVMAGRRRKAASTLDLAVT